MNESRPIPPALLRGAVPASPIPPPPEPLVDAADVLEDAVARLRARAAGRPFDALGDAVVRQAEVVAVLAREHGVRRCELADAYRTAARLPGDGVGATVRARLCTRLADLLGPAPAAAERALPAVLARPAHVLWSAFAEGLDRRVAARLPIGEADVPFLGLLARVYRDEARRLGT